MDVVLYMAVTVNGMVADEEDKTDFVSENEWIYFRDMIEEEGNLIIGRRTYEVMLAEDEFQEIDTNLTIIVSDQALESEQENHAVAESPREALRILEEKGFSDALVAGGGKLNGSFMREGLVDEIYLDVMPAALGTGIPLFGDIGFEAGLELLGVERLGQDELQLHYSVEH